MACVLAFTFVMVALTSLQEMRGPGTMLTWLNAPEPAAEEVDELTEFEVKPLEPEIRQVAVQSGDTLTQLLIEAGTEPADAQSAVRALSQVYDASDLRQGQMVTLTFAPQGAPLLAVALKPSVERDVSAARKDDGTYAADETVKKLIATDARASGTIKGSLYISAKAQGVPDAVIVDLIRIYSYDVDFQREVKSGDHFDILYTDYIDEGGESIKGGAIQYAELTLGREKKPLYRFTTSDDQVTDYFTPKGWSGKRQLMRTPIDGARLTSTFGLRRHPILGYTKMHKGVDFGAPTGTPVMAAGNGTVEMASWFGGYGRYIRLKHTNSYGTAYAHLSRFARGIEPGARVRQGQVIGFVGTSGRSTGPHLHYEVMQATKQINPMGVKIPTGRNLSGSDLAKFKEQVTHVAALLDALPPEPALVAGGVQPVQASFAPN